jgi:uncharacterized membrane protein YeaQ/YmgE (transglycosylase-associated protein family)
LVAAIAGVLARWIMPGSGPSGFLITIVVGMVGALIGGFVVGIFGATGAAGLNFWSILVATLGAVILPFFYGLIARRSA